MPRGQQRTGDTDGSNRSRKPTRAGYKPHRQAEFQGWVNISIPETSKAAFAEFEQSAAFIDALDLIGRDHIRLSVVQEYGEESYVASAFHMDETKPSGGLMVSQRSGSALRALAKLAFCIIELMPDDWGELAGTGKADW